MTFKLWVIELFNEQTLRWEPTVGVGLSRADGRVEMRQWRKNLPADRLRLRCYKKEGAQ